MSTKHFTANVISATKVVPDGKLTNSAASGVWTLDEHYDLVRGDNWPNVANLAPTAFFSVGSSDVDLDKVAIGTLGNAVDFGDMNMKEPRAGIASTTRGIFTSGKDTSTSEPNEPSTTIQYFTIATGGTLQDFGDIADPSAGNRTGFGVASSTRGIIAGGFSQNTGTGNITNIDNINYVTIAATGNTTDFGDLTAVGGPSGGGCSSTRGVFMGKFITTGSSNVIDYITIASTGDATDFGDAGGNRKVGAGASNSTRAIAAGMDNNVIEYVTIASTGNASDFGDLTESNEGGMGAASPTRMLIAAGQSFGTSIDYITIATTGNAADFGSVTRSTGVGSGGLSNAHGGIA